ncbi:LppU/SCO3897 family protein [Hamadaea tsunoensis]|uniref:LppU/SCO3897 family protein n=1 Tax=Hamadaea tsunoensis TaxID=53368 RepID=UPI00041556A7|nr:hypothetical protein [Hamadaea tsunoensis]
MSDPITYNPAPQGAPQQQPAFGGPVQPGVPPQEPSRGKAIAKGIGAALLWRLIIGAVVLVIAGGWFAYKYFSGNITAKTPTVGECVTAAKTDADVDNVKTVDCNSPDAADKVVGVLNDQSYSSFKASDNPCTAYPTAESAIFYGKDTNGFVLCLVPAKS